MHCQKKFLYIVAGFIALGSALPQVARSQNVAITFDDLPLNGILPIGVTEVAITKEVLAILKQRHVPPVFGFINAKKLEGNPNGAAALQLWIDAGQRVGNHSYSHMNLHTSTPEAFIRDIELNEPALERLAKNDEWRWLRYPYLREGDTAEKRRAVRSYLREHKYEIAQVTLDYEDYLWNNPYARCAIKHDMQSMEWLRSSYLRTATEYLNANRAMAKLVFGRDINHVLLLHLGAFSVNILPDLLDLLQKKGFHLVTLEEAQRDPAYRTDPDAGSKWGGTLLEQWLDARHMQYPKVSGKPQKELDALCR
jgi:peptidoglycan/xylan/chitin deacetylase (PgdA/CDA1 family)